jgi:hypothetical protein
MSKKIQVISGQVFGKLRVISEITTGSKTRTFLFRCECGKEKEIALTNVRNRGVKTCGCRTGGAPRGKFTHGMSKTRFYRCWAGMIERCTNKNKKEFQHYGGRGISVTGSWHKFEPFMIDMYTSYLLFSKHNTEKKTTIDRIDTDGNYEPNNCRWATPSQQKRNCRSNVNITYMGETHCMAAWGKKFGIPRETIRRRLGRNLPMEQVFALSLVKKFVEYKGRTQSVSDWARELCVDRRRLSYQLKKGVAMEIAIGIERSKK